MAKKLDEDYPDAAEVAKEQRGVIEEFSKNLPLIRCFTSEAITEEDWKEIVEVVGITPFEKDEIKVAQFIDNDLYKFIPEIEEITQRAEKKFSLAQKLKVYKEEMKKFDLELTDYKGISFLIKGYDDINTKLDD